LGTVLLGGFNRPETDSGSMALHKVRSSSQWMDRVTIDLANCLLSSEFMYETFYLLHDCFEPAATNGIRRKISPELVRSIERYCCQSVREIAPIDRALITNAAAVRAHFQEWGRVLVGDGLEPEQIIDAFAAYLLAQLQQSSTDAAIQAHWIAFFQQRCAIVSRQVWQMVPESARSIELFEEFVSHSYGGIANLQEVRLVFANFRTEHSEYVSGLNHIKAYVDRRIRYSLQPYARQLAADPNVGLSDLGVAARYSRSAVSKALAYFHPSERVADLLVLWGWFDRYRRDTGIPVNRLTASDFIQIGNDYQHSCPHVPSLTWEAVKQQLIDIGTAIRRHQSQRTDSLDVRLGSEGEGIALGDTKLGNQHDLLQSLAARQIVRQANRELTTLLDEPTIASKPSPQQLFWLYYGLRLTQQQIGTLVALNFGLNPSPGSISLRLTKSHRYLFDRLHATLDNAPPTRTHLEINAAMSELLTAYFHDRMPQLLRSRLIKLQLRSSQLTDSQKAEIVTTLVSSLAKKIDLQIPIAATAINIECFFQDL
jgi:hypothetical protein